METKRKVEYYKYLEANDGFYPDMLGQKDTDEGFFIGIGHSVVYNGKIPLQKSEAIIETSSGDILRIDYKLLKSFKS